MGKTSLMLRFIDNNFHETKAPTIGLDFLKKTIDAKNNVKMKLQLWDTAGQERFRPIIKTFYNGTKSAVIVFDLM